MCPLLSNRINLSAALGGYIYASGGARAGIMGPTERYDPVANTWTRLGDLGFWFYNGEVAVLKGQIWACGGAVAGNETLYLDTCHILDTSTNAWTSAPTMNVPRSVILNRSVKSHRVLDSDSCSVFSEHASVWLR